MFTKTLIFALAASPLVAAHGKIAMVAGDAGGNGTALAIKGAVVPGAGPNSKTEVDTTVFSKKQAGTDAKSDGFGKTTGSGQNTANMLKEAMAQSGSTLPQVTQGGSINGTYHIVTTDGAGPVRAILDTEGKGEFSKGTELEVTTNVPGNNGNIKATKGKRSFIGELWDRSTDALAARGLITKRAANVNTDHQFSVKIPAGTTCNGEASGQTNICWVKVANPSNAGPFGGVFAIQMAGGGSAGNGTTATASTDKATAGTGSKAAAATDKKGNKKNKNTKRFTA
ncbi:hypothetical protein MCOR25_001460 [Pyricularia grisea]|uniref:Uncharacterized protein n=1 Tax=Pyricularia grisea TaxID=148305 RepID=A0A6P8AW89_PYRGI|nr:uncharacterized protein PgNI_09008 [Pyricularia grisea]KAI6380788.1 hypothetical protein MCOR25_001460 [Pyricularia grisea]TLD06496.1 hypothetical protein PgNI_09008 [Pyricularia grisea]